MASGTLYRNWDWHELCRLRTLVWDAPNPRYSRYSTSTKSHSSVFLYWWWSQRDVDKYARFKGERKGHEITLSLARPTLIVILE